jgi:hypothetical protein
MTISDHFRKMADALDHNKDRPFGGAFVAVIPSIEDGGEPTVLDLLILDSKQNAGQFWGLLQAKCKLALDEINAVERSGQAFGRR